MELQQGRPADCTGRLPKEIRVYDFLDRLGIDYQRLDHEVVMTMDACVDIDAAMETELCKNLLLNDHKHTQFFLLMLPGEKSVRANALARQIGSPRLHFADGCYMEEFLDITPGSLSVLGLINDRENRVQLLIDRDLLETEFLSCHPNINTSSLKIRMTDFLEKILPATGHEPVFVTI